MPSRRPPKTCNTGWLVVPVWRKYSIVKSNMDEARTRITYEPVLWGTVKARRNVDAQRDSNADLRYPCARQRSRSSQREDITCLHIRVGTHSWLRPVH